MRLDVAFNPGVLAPGEVQGRTVCVVDILRAGTTMCAALHHGARAVVPVASTEEALRLAQTLGTAETVLAGERNCVRIPGFALGNGPFEPQPEVVRGKTVVMTTTNGTGTLLATQGAAAVYLAAAANFSIVGARLHEVWERDRDLILVCAGREGRFALEDAYTAGRMAEAALGGRRGRKGLNDAAIVALDLVRRYGDRWERPLVTSRAGRDLIALGMEADVAECTRVDAYPVLAQFQNRRVVIAPPPGAQAQ